MKAHRNLINEKIADSKWSEVIQLYSGLFENENDRVEFVIDLSDFDISLAIDCKLTSLNNEDLIVYELAQKINKIYNLSNNNIESLRSVYNLIKLGKDAYLEDYILKFKAKGNIKDLFLLIIEKYDDNRKSKLLIDLIKYRRTIYSKWLINNLYHQDFYDISLNEIKELLKTLILVRKRNSFKLIFKLIKIYNIENQYSKEYIINILEKKGSKNCLNLVKWLNKFYFY